MTHDPEEPAQPYTGDTLPLPTIREPGAPVAQERNQPQPPKSPAKSGARKQTPGARAKSTPQRQSMGVPVVPAARASAPARSRTKVRARGPSRRAASRDWRRIITRIGMASVVALLLLCALLFVLQQQ